jgi:hypothetical protein
MAYPTKTITLVSEEGVPLQVTVPTEVPSNERGAYLRKLWDDHVTLLSATWKGPVSAVVPAALADDVAEAMEFMGALVDSRGGALTGFVRLYSKGYYAHGF